MRTLLEAILGKSEVLLEDAKRLTVKEAVLEEDSFARCIKTANGYSIRSGRARYGKGRTKDDAWENAILNLLSL